MEIELKRKLEYEKLYQQIQKQKLEETQIEEELAYRVRLVESGIPQNLLNEKNFDKFDCSNIRNGFQIIQQIKNFITCKDSNRFLTLYGNTGRGKTFLALVIGIEVLKNNFVMYTHVADLKDLLQHKQLNDTYFEYMNQLKSVYCLILDDYSDFKESEFIVEKLDILLNHRYDYKLMTVVTTNKNLVELTKFNKRIASRLMSGLCIELVGNDYRIESAKLKKVV